MTRWRRLFVCASLAVAGCGGGSSPSQPPTPIPSQTPTPVPTTAGFLSPTGSPAQPLVISRSQGTVITVNIPSYSFAVGSAPSGCVDEAVFGANPYATFTVTAAASAPANCTATITVIAGPNTGYVYVVVP